MRSRNWGWLRERILGLLARPANGENSDGSRIFTTRLQTALFTETPAHEEPDHAQR